MSGIAQVQNPRPAVNTEAGGIWAGFLMEIHRLRGVAAARRAARLAAGTDSKTDNSVLSRETESAPAVPG